MLAALAILAVTLCLVFPSTPQPAPPAAVPISKVVARAKDGAVKSVILSQVSNEIAIFYSDGTSERSLKETGSFLDYLQRAGVPADRLPVVEVGAVASGPALPFNPLLALLPALLVGGAVILITILANRHAGKAENRSQDQQSSQATAFARSRARLIVADRPATTFADVAGVDEAKEELAEVVDFLKRPQKYSALGARMPKGLLMVGPPGTGKTLLARAVAGEAGVPFLSISGSEFVEMFVGVGAARVRDLFEQAKRNSPCIVFVDEIDAVGRHRGGSLGSGNDEREQTLNQILVEMDGFDTHTNVIVIAATNRPDVLDKALLRPGRFDRQVMLGLPDQKGRLAILQVHARGKPLAEEVDLDTVARQTPGFSGADLENLLNEAALLAARRDAFTVGRQDLAEAIDRVIAGPRRKSHIISVRERTITAYHEAGHALVAHALPHVDPVAKISIVSRGATGGYTRVLPTEDRNLFTRSEFKDNLAWALGGHAAEQRVFGEMSTGASNDIQRATQLARRMVTVYGMSERLGPVALAGSEESPYPAEYGEQREYSKEIAYLVDQEVRALPEEAS